MNPQNHSSAGILTFTLLIPWTSPSENQVRSQHWTRTRKQNVAAKDAWVLALKSSDLAVNTLTQIISALGSSRSETPLREASGLMTETSASDGTTANAPPMDKPKP